MARVYLRAHGSKISVYISCRRVHSCWCLVTHSRVYCIYVQRQLYNPKMAKRETLAIVQYNSFFLQMERR